MADEYFSPSGQQQNLYPQQQDFSRLPYQQQQQQQQRWAQAQQQMRANQYAQAMKQKQMAMRYPQQQQPGYSQSPAFSQQFNFPGTPQQPNPMNINPMQQNPTTPRDGSFPPNAQRDFSTPQREFSQTGTPVPVPSREFSGTPAPAPSSTPGPGNRDLSQPHPNRMGMNMMQPHPGSRTGTPIVRPGTAMSGGGNFNERTSQPPQTPKMGVGMSMNGMSIPNVPNMGMPGNGMNMPGMGMNNNIGMPANSMGGMGMANGMGNNMAMGNVGVNNLGMANNMNNSLGMSGTGMNLNMGANMPANNNLGMQGANNLGGNNLGMQANNLGMQANNLGMQANNLGMQANNLGMPGAANNLGMPGANNLGMPGAGNMSPTKPMGLGINVGGTPNALGMAAGANPLGMGGSTNALGMGGANNGLGMGGAPNALGMGGAPNTLGMGGATNAMGMGAGAGMGGAANALGMSAANAMGSGAANPMAMGAGTGATNPLGMGTSGANPLGMGTSGANPLGMGAATNPMAMGAGGANPMAMGAGGANPMAMGGATNALGMGPGPASALGMSGGANALGMNPAANALGMAPGANALGMPGGANALGMGGMGAMGMNGVNGMAMNGINGLRANAPNKLSRRVVSNPSTAPLPSPTKTSTAPALPLPPGVNPQTTLVTALPLLKDENDVTHGGALPPVSEAEMKEIKYWMSRDNAFQEAYGRVCEYRKEEETALRSRVAWWETDESSHAMPGKFQIWWPAEMRKVKERKMKLLGRNFKCLDTTLLVKSGQAITQPEVLVPIRIEVDHDHYRLRDTFTWNLNDPAISPDDFAQCLCDDFQIDSKTVVAAVSKSISEQLAEHRAHIVEPTSGPKRDILRGEISEKDSEWWARWRSRVVEGTVDATVTPEDEPVFDEVVDKEKDMNEELRVLVKLDVIVGSMNLTDQLEWDINDPSNSPEEFAEIYCQDLGLGGEFKTAVAHSIREQVSVYQKSLFLVGHPFDGTPIADDELRTAMLPPIDHSFRFDRTLLEQFTPQLNVLQDGEIERNERERERELKRKRRQTRGRRGIVLPDRDLQKTHRTAIGFAEVEVPAQQAAQQQQPVTFRRAAAAAASLTIANLAATENGTPVPTNMHMMENQRLTPVIPQQPQPQAPPPKQKQKRTGVLQPPPLPQHIFLARAGAGGVPTPTTGLEPAEASAARAEFGDNAPEPTSPGGGANEAADSDGQAAMLRRVLEKEGAESTEGLHQNMIDGTWHCANCGCPESISVGRRKGPLGQGTMCGECGKYWHKHRKPRPVDYNTSIEHHLNLKKQAKAKKRGKANVNANPSPSKPSSARDEAPAADALANGRDSLSPSPPPQKPTSLPFLDPGSPDSTVGADSPKVESGSLPPVKKEEEPSPPEPTEPTESTEPTAPAEPTPAQKSPSLGSTPPAPSTPTATPQAPTQTRDGIAVPQWITDCIAATQRRYTSDRIDVIVKPRADGNAPPEFRLKCLDCPGKLYTPGPEQSLSNFEVHLKNRVHRANVNRRVTAETGKAPSSAPEAQKLTPSASTQSN